MRHLTRDDLLDCAERPDRAHRNPHLASCQACRDVVADLRAVLETMPADMPEPSPLFWEQFSIRVSEAVGRQPVGSAHSWWLGWRPAVLAVSAAALLMLVVLDRQRAPELTQASAKPASVVQGVAEQEPTGADDASLNLIGLLAQDLDWDATVEAGLRGTTGTVDRVFTDLTVDERAEVQKLLAAELARQSGV